ncbi:MAG: transposase [Chloracidobacterium sp.]|nr:transposase [Chloracidobacterium sp.]
MRYKRFLHSDKAGIKAFYRKCGKDAVIGTEATGSLWWFEKLLFDNGMTLKIGDPRMIRRAALSRHKNDHRDAETILDLLMRDISGDHAENEQSREMLDLLNYRHSLVSKRTSVVNQLQAFARSKGLPRFRLPVVKARKKIEEVETTQVERLLVSSRFVLCDELTRQIRPWRAARRRANKEERAQLLMTHPASG